MSSSPPQLSPGARARRPVPFTMVLSRLKRFLFFYVTHFPQFHHLRLCSTGPLLCAPFHQASLTRTCLRTSLFRFFESAAFPCHCVHAPSLRCPCCLPLHGSVPSPMISISCQIDNGLPSPTLTPIPTVRQIFELSLPSKESMEIVSSAG